MTIKKNKNKQKEDENDDLFWYTNDHDADDVARLHRHVDKIMWSYE